MRMRTSLAAGTALLLLLGTHDSAPAVARATRGLWRGLAEPRVLAAAREGGQQQPAKPASPPAQQPADTGQQPPVFRAGINYVRVDVIISDKNGNPVADLQASDFDVSEDNKPQKIDTFKLIKLDGGTADAIKEPPKEIRNDFDEESEAARDDVRLFAIFLDDYHVRRGASMAVRGQLAKFIDTQIGPSDMIGVMYPLESTGSVRMTRNHSAVSRGLQGFLGRKYEYEPKNQFEEQYAHYPTETVERIRNQVSLSALKGLIVHMGTLKEGRKSLILVSEGYTYMVPPQMRNADATQPGLGNPNVFNPNAGQNDINEDRAAWTAGLDMDSDLREIYDTANRNNVAIYAVDPRGLPGFEFDINEGVGLQTDTKYLNTTMDSLRTLAENTDGRAIVNRNDIATGMKQITRDSSAYYLIGYNSAQAPADGKFHEIKVKVKRPGLQVRARRGYWALNREELARATAPAKPAPPKPVEAAIANAVVRPSRASVVRSWVGMSRGENGKTRVTFVWEPLPKQLGEKPGSREEPAGVTITAVAPDGSPYFRGAVPSRITFDVNPGKIQLRMSVTGAASQVLDSETRELAIPDLTSTQTMIGTPEVLRARTARELQQLKSDPAGIPIAAREFSRTDRLIIRVPAYGPGGTTPTLSVHLLSRAGSAMSELAPAPAPTAGMQQVELPLAALAPGEYVVEIKATGEGGEATEHVGFRVTS
jgi:VWFA-related protein